MIRSRENGNGGRINPPVWRTSTHLYADSADLARGRPNEDGHFYYGRRGTPTQWALADALTGMEPGAAGTLLYPSGLAAITGALLGLLAVVKLVDLGFDAVLARPFNLVYDWSLLRAGAEFLHASIGRAGAILAPTAAGVLLDAGWTPEQLYFAVAGVVVLAAGTLLAMRPARPATAATERVAAPAVTEPRP